MAEGSELTQNDATKTIFDEIRQLDGSNAEFWSARDLMLLLEYKSWQTFEPLIHKAMESFRTSGGSVDNHFMAGHKMVSIGYGNERALKDYKLSRQASYLIAMNGDPDQKPRIAEAQNYFAIKTRQQELHETSAADVERLKERAKYTDSDKQLSNAVMESGISPRGLAQIKSDGDKVFFGGYDTEDMKAKYDMPNSKPLADKMPTVLLSAKGLTNQMTKWKIENNGLFGIESIDEQHSAHSKSVRETLVEEGITPEELPPEEDTKVIMRRIQDANNIKRMLGES